MSRYSLKPADRVEVVDAADGDLVEFRHPEDGHMVARRAPRAALVTLETAAGRRYTLQMDFGTDFQLAVELVDAIVAHGSVDLAKWVRGRTVYGSEAYVRDRCWLDDENWEREQEGVAPLMG